MDEKTIRVLVVASLLVFSYGLGILSIEVYKWISEERQQVIDEAYTNGTITGSNAVVEFLVLQATQCNPDGIQIPYLNETLVLYWEGCFEQ